MKVCRVLLGRRAARLLGSECTMVSLFCQADLRAGQDRYRKASCGSADRLGGRIPNLAIYLPRYLVFTNYILRRELCVWLG
ncbi:hypothetical protein F5X99DRAFT_400072 [Biscogniauxia marginata]|nr:hypothetical protein F5X99DRAFT_400072 [Biscogniauxia marginata]